MKYFLITLLLIILLACTLTWAGIYLPVDADSTGQVIFSIKKGEGAKEIAINLEKQGLIGWRSLFRIYVLTKGAAGNLKAGEYELSPAMAIPEIVNKLVSGEVIKKTITIIEGWTLKNIGEYLEEKGVEGAEKIAPDLEGYLFPDTYEISPEDGLEEIIEKIRANFEKKLTPELREEIASQNKTIPEIVTMASLLEKEVKTLEDKKIVSGILWKRLETGIPLQVDATITYIIGKKDVKISLEETKIDSPYNTYKYRGLPLGPICNPGLESIIAAIYSQESDFWYYLSTPEGKTIFSKTLEEHNIAKAKYLK